MNQPEGDIQVDLRYVYDRMADARRHTRHLHEDLLALDGQFVGGNAGERAIVTRALLEAADQAALLSAQLAVVGGLVRTEYWRVRG